MAVIWQNTRTGYGLVARLLHWGMALLMLAQCGLGFYVDTLTYYHPWYRIAPDMHRSVGLLLLLLAGLRLTWRWWSPPPPLEEHLAPLEKVAAHGVHGMLYVLMFALPVAGYLLSTADGRAVGFFGWFDLPALLPAAKGREIWAGNLHLFLGISLLVLVFLHAGAAIKHHVIDRDRTLRRMWSGPDLDP